MMHVETKALEILFTLFRPLSLRRLTIFLGPCLLQGLGNERLQYPTNRIWRGVRARCLCHHYVRRAPASCVITNETQGAWQLPPTPVVLFAYSLAPSRSQASRPAAGFEAQHLVSHPLASAWIGACAQLGSAQHRARGDATR